MKAGVKVQTRVGDIVRVCASALPEYGLGVRISQYDLRVTAITKHGEEWRICGFDGSLPLFQGGGYMTNVRSWIRIRRQPRAKGNKK